MGWLESIASVVVPAPAYAAYKGGEALTKPSAESEAAFGKLRARWNALSEWGLGVKIPSTHSQYESWLMFSTNWDMGRPDPTGLTAQEANLGVAEKLAVAQGFNGGVLPPPVKAPSASESTAAYKAATAVDEGAKAAESAAADVAKAAAESSSAAASFLPFKAKVALGVAGTLAAALILGPYVRVFGRRS